MSSQRDLLNSLIEEINDLENVEDSDEGNDESSSGKLFSISSFGIDHTVEALVKKLNKEQYYIPKFQRKYVWSQNDASRFIESLLLGLPVPGIFLYKESDSQRHLVIDGQQRLKSLAKFYKGVFGKKAFHLSGLKSKWNDLSYGQLEEDDRLRLDDAIIHATIFKQDTPTDNMDSVYEVFERINTGGMKLSPQEIRTCVAHGSFNDFLFIANENETWRNIFGPTSQRLKDIELILRFFAFRDSLSSYTKPMKLFLTNFMSQNRNMGTQALYQKDEIWNNLIDRLSSALPVKPFRPGGRALNAAFWDSFSVAASQQISADPATTNDKIRRAYLSLESSKEFIALISSSTSDDESVKRRFKLAKEAFDDANTK